MKIAYVGEFPYPGSTASTHRVRGIAQALAIAGHDVTMVPLTMGDEPHDRDFNTDSSISRRAMAGTVTNAAATLVGGSRAIPWLKGRGRDFDVAVVYGTRAALLARYFWSARHGSNAVPPIVLDVVEWYDYSSRPGGLLGPFAAEHAVAMNFIATRATSAICISTFLARHFAGHGCRVEVVPPLFQSMSVAHEPVQPFPANVNIGYAGSPGAKDGPGLANLVAAAVSLPEALRARLQIHIVGLNADQGHSMLRRYSSVLVGDLSDVVTWHGRVSSDQAQRIVAACQFTYLQRPRARYAMAGFPTKVVESLMLGTPVIVNATSDLVKYVDDGRNGILLDRDGLDGCGRLAVSAALTRVLVPGFRLALDREQICKQSSGSFDPQCYAAPLDRLVMAAITR